MHKGGGREPPIPTSSDQGGGESGRLTFSLSEHGPRKEGKKRKEKRKAILLRTEKGGKATAPPTDTSGAGRREEKPNWPFCSMGSEERGKD